MTMWSQNQCCSRVPAGLSPFGISLVEEVQMPVHWIPQPGMGLWPTQWHLGHCLQCIDCRHTLPLWAIRPNLLCPMGMTWCGQTLRSSRCPGRVLWRFPRPSLSPDRLQIAQVGSINKQQGITQKKLRWRSCLLLLVEWEISDSAKFRGNVPGPLRKEFSSFIFYVRAIRKVFE